MLAIKTGLGNSSLLERVQESCPLLCSLTPACNQTPWAYGSISRMGSQIDVMTDDS